MSSKRWLKRHVNDTFVKQSIREKTRSRSYYKLLEINKKYNIITKANYILDLGSAPGGWSLVCVHIKEKTEKPLDLISIDLLDMEAVESKQSNINTKFIAKGGREIIT